MNKRFAMVVLAFALLTSACTIEQLKTYQAVTGDILSTERHEALAKLPDHAWKLGDGSVIELDGSVTPPTPCDVEKTRVNAQPYFANNPAPAMDAFRAVARCRGWSQGHIDSWAIAVEDIMRFESGFCYNRLGGSLINDGANCDSLRQGRREDAGFGQLISIHYKGWLCAQEGLCSKWEVIATPWSSMTALLALIERSGTSGYCYNAYARSLHKRTCRNPGWDV